MSRFQFKYFSIEQTEQVHKVGTDAMLLGALVYHHSPANILDIGTGTGVLGLMMAQKFPQASISAIELQQDAAVLAQKNFRTSPFSDRLEVLHMDARALHNRQFDLLLSNPPYYNEETKSNTATRATARHEDALPLPDLLETAVKLMHPTSTFWLILPHRRYDELQAHLSTSPLSLHRVIFIAGETTPIVRVIVSLSLNSPETMQEETICIRTASGHYTEEYIELTKEFHAFRPLK
jgi:tRNA1Val (adenine37-N6)-methyltransferase